MGQCLGKSTYYTLQMNYSKFSPFSNVFMMNEYYDLIIKVVVRKTKNSA